MAKTTKAAHFGLGGDHNVFDHVNYRYMLYFTPVLTITIGKLKHW